MMSIEIRDSLLRIDNFSFYSRGDFSDVNYQSYGNIWTSELTRIRSFRRIKTFVNRQGLAGSLEINYVRDIRKHKCLQLRRSN